MEPVTTVAAETGVFAKIIGYFAGLPTSGLIKAGILIGVTGVTLFIMIRRLIKMYKESHAETSERRSPVDDILNVNYVTDPEAFEDMDPEAQRICRNLNKSVKKNRKRGGKKSKKTKKDIRPVQTVSLFDGPMPELYPDASTMMFAENRKRKKAPVDRKHLLELKQVCEEWKASGLSADAFRERIDEIARELGLSVDSLDRAVEESVRQEFSALF